MISLQLDVQLVIVIYILPLAYLPVMIYGIQVIFYLSDKMILINNLPSI